MISVFEPDESGYHDDWQVWIDTDIGARDGICLGCGETKDEALEQALKALTEELNTVKTIRYGAK